MFAAGGLGGDSGSYVCPAPESLCVTVDGNAYLVDVTWPQRGAVVARSDVQHVVAVPDEQLLLLAGFQDIVAVGIRGIAWRSSRLALDCLQIDHASAGRIYCHGEDMSGWVDLELDAATGQQVRAG